MKGWIWIPVALLMGLVAGAVGPRAELRKAKEEMAQLRSRVEETDKEKTRIEDVLRMLQVPKASGASSRVRRAAPSPVIAVPASPSSNATLSAEGSTSTSSSERHGAFQAGGPTRHRHAGHPEGGAMEDGASLSNRIQQAVELWRLRSDIARSTLVADVGLDATQAKDFDVLVGAMNMRLGERIGHWAGELAATNASPPETVVRLMNDLTGALVLTYDEMDRKLPSDWRVKAGESANLLDFIDPSVALPLIGVEHKLQARPHKRTEAGEMSVDVEEAE